MSTGRTALALVAAGAGLLLCACQPEDGPAKTMTADTSVSGAVHQVVVLGDRSGSITVAPGTGSGVTVKRTVHYKDSGNPHPSQHLSGGVLTFAMGCDDCYIDYTLTVPASAAVRLGNSSGAIDVRGVASAAVSTSSGAVTVSGVPGDLTVDGSSGTVNGTDLGGGATDRVSTSSGSVALALDHRPGSVTVTASSGNVNLTVPAGPYHVNASTTSGARHIGVTDTPAGGADLTVRTSSGNITVTGK